jgi:hypothetical protein
VAHHFGVETTMAALSAAQATAARTAQVQLKKYPRAATAMGGSVTLGPFEISYSMSAGSVKVSASVKFGPLKKKLFTATLTPAKRSITASANAGIVKVSLTVSADFSRMRITISGSACVRKLTGGWSCKAFSKTIG